MKTPIPISVFIGSYLSYSETFIYDQLVHQKKFKAQVCAYKLNPARERFPYEPVCALQPLQNLLYSTIGYSPRFEKAIRNYDSQLIHAHFGTNGTLARPFAEKLKLPLVVTFHGHDVGGLKPENRWNWRYARYQMLAPKLFEQAALCLPASQDLADDLIDLGLSPSKIEVHRLGIDLGRFSYQTRKEGPLKVLCIGRFVEKKGFEYAIRAFAQLHKDNSEVQMTLVGNGPLHGYYQQLIQELETESPGLTNAICFPGTMLPKNLSALMLEHDCLLAPSVIAANGDKESGLLVLKEGAATGMPGIGTYHGGLPEIIDHEQTGFLVEERNAQQIYQALSELDRSVSLRREMGRAARVQMEVKYDTLKQNEILEQHFNLVLKNA